MNSYMPHVLIAISVLTSIMAAAPAFASVVPQEACPDCPDNMDNQAVQENRFSDVPVRIWADKQIYNYGSDIHVQGVVSSLKGSTPVTVKVTSPQGNVVSVEQIQIGNSKTFEAVFNTGGDLWKENGQYVIRAQYGAQNINDKVVVELAGGPGIMTTATCKAGELAVSSTSNSYCIPVTADGVTIGKATISRSTSSITMTVDAKTDGTITLSIPRSILDSQSNGGDSPFVILADDQESSDAYEVSSDSTTRTVQIVVPEGTSKVEIVGTFAVPEFGTMAAIILAVAIVSIIAVSARSRLSILPKY